MQQKSIRELSADLQAKQVSATELASSYIAHARQLNDSLNALITICEEQAMAEAKAADDLIASGNAGPLTGIPMVHKDIFCTQGVKTTCGSKMLDNFIAPYDATVVRKVREAGAVCIAKANMDEFAMGSSNETSYFGTVKNPWALDRVPGGSSGGSAAAVASRMVPIATATDTGGSIRQPAALTGVCGLKPTYGLVSRYGMIAFASSLDQGGPMARSADDMAILLQAMSGFDPLDSTSINQPVPDYSAALNQDLRGLKIGLPKEYFDGLETEMASVIEASIDEFKKQGAEVVEVSLPNSHLSAPAYYVVAPAECSSNLSRFDGVRFGHRCSEPENLEDLYKRSRAEGFGEEVQRRILVGTYALSAGYYDAYYLKAQRVRRLISDDFRKVFEQVDVIMGPTTPAPAFKFGEKSADPIAMYLSDVYTIATNLAGLPGMSIPAGFINGLPVGLQVIGNYFDEARMLNIAHQYQQVTDWHTRAPEGF